MKKIAWIVLGCGVLWVASPLFAEPSIGMGTKDGGEAPMTEVVDIPTAEILDPLTYSYASRFYSNGGVVQKFLVGPIKRVNMGIAFDVERMIGGGSPHMIRPSVFFKVRAFDGTDVLPALALGYENLGYLWQDSVKQYMNREKGLYLVGSHEIFIPNLEVHAGVNMYDFNSSAAVFGFFGATYKVTQSFALLSEYDNIRNGPDNRFNFGGRLFITPFLNVDVAARNIGRNSDRGAERIVRLNYVGNFSL